MKQMILMVVATLVSVAMGAVKLADPFANGMVLQRDKPCAVWGTAEPGARVTVSFAGQEKSATVGADGRWRIRLDPMPASAEGRTLTATSASTSSTSSTFSTSVSDILVGEVYFVCGQSNAEVPFQDRGNPHFSDRLGATLAQTIDEPLVRFVYQSNYNQQANEPKVRAALPVVWKKMNPHNLTAWPTFSAIGTYFGLELHRATRVPVGLIGAYWGGTRIEPWIPKAGYGTDWRLFALRDWKVRTKAELDGPVGAELLKLFQTDNSYYRATYQQPSVLFNEMVNPWCPFAMRGIVWYQGCSNANRPGRYVDLLHAFYRGWANRFEDPTLAFHIVQLAPWGDGGHPEFQEAQERYAREEPNADLAVINDIGCLTDIHPWEKHTVGLRLALHAMRRDCGMSCVKDNSPTLKTWALDGDTFELAFYDAEALHLRNADWSVATPFEIAGADGVFKPARIANLKVMTQAPDRSYGIITGKTLRVRSPEVKSPRRLRYLWSRPWLGTVYNEVNLPIGAFHIDVPELVPMTAAHEAWLRRGVSAIVHWGPNTYTGSEWGFGNADPAVVAPDALDPSQWAAAMKAGGINLVVLVAKHHDGFCLWPSKYNADYSTAAIPGALKGADIVGQLAQACRKERMAFGAYLSPWDRHQANYGEPEYVTYFHKQWDELMANYGPLAEIWLDGANGGDGWYGGANGGKGETRTLPDGDLYYRRGALLKRLVAHNPMALAFGGAGMNSVTWCLNEVGNVQDDWQYARLGEDGRYFFLPPECDTPLRNRWFYHDQDRPKSLRQLVRNYFESVGRGGVLNLGIAPDRHGRVCDDDVRRLAEFGDYVRRFNAVDFAKGAKLALSNDAHAARLELTLADADSFNAVDFGEDLSRGQLTTYWSVEVGEGKDWRLVAEGTAAGYRRIVRFPAVRSSRVRILCHGSLGCPTIVRPAVRFAPDVKSDGTVEIGETDTARWMTGNK